MASDIMPDPSQFSKVRFGSDHGELGSPGPASGVTVMRDLKGGHHSLVMEQGLQPSRLSSLHRLPPRRPPGTSLCANGCFGSGPTLSLAPAGRGTFLPQC